MATILIVIKASLLLGAALLGARLLRGSAAGTRHAVWSVTFAALLALPLLGAAVPALHVPMPAAWAGVMPGLETGTTAARIQPSSEYVQGLTRPTDEARVAQHAPEKAAVKVAAGSPPSSSPARLVDGLSAWTFVRGIWMAGALAAAGVLLLSLVRVRRLARTARDVADPAWREAVDRLAARLALTRPVRVLVSSAVRTPMAGGVWRPLIFLPEDAVSWAPDRRDIVLAHELSHIARRDPLRHLAARLAVACYWFHPLAWIAARESSLAREQACDEAVLALGVRPSEYASVLLDFADALPPARGAAAALPIVERSLLEARLMAILDHQSPSRLRHPFIPAAAAALVALTLAAAQPAARSVEIRTPAPAAPPAHSTPTVEDTHVAGVATGAPAAQGLRDGTCWFGSADRGFTGSSTTDERGTIVERVGRNRGGDWIIQQRFGDIRVCMLAQGGTADRGDGPTAWAARLPLVIVETVRGAETMHYEVRREGGAPRTAWRVNGAERPFDASAQAWRDAVLAVLDQSWAISSLRGEESSLRGDISSLRGDESSLRGEISSLRGDVSSMRGEQSSIRGDESSLRGEVSSIQGELSSLHGQISSERGAISSLQGSRYGLSDAEQSKLTQEIRAHEKEIARLEQEITDYDANKRIADVERRIRELNADGKVAALENEIRKFDERGKTAAIEKQIEALNVEGKSADIERRIQALDADRRTRQMEVRLDEAVKRLQQALAAIR